MAAVAPASDRPLVEIRALTKAYERGSERVEVRAEDATLSVLVAYRRRTTGEAHEDVFRSQGVGI